MAQSSGVQKGSSAVVIGGSMTGLLAARVLSDHFEQVTVIDRDLFPESPEFRKGVPQGHHVHVMLVKGREILEQLFPGLDQELLAGGAKPLEWGHDSVSLTANGWLPRLHTGLVSYTASRPFLEWAVRCRVAANPRVRFMQGCEVSDLVADPSRTCITGVKVKFRRGANDGEENLLNADLVVDASGRESRASKWLQALGYEPPQEIVINSFVGYATRLFERPANFICDWNMMFVIARPPKLARGGIISLLENGQWIVTIAGAAREYPPTDEAGFMEFARGLATPQFYEAIKDAKPVSPIYGYRQTANQLRYFERLSRWPDNFVVTGDAVCAFNPVYGQGMTLAAQDAMLLGTCLHEQRQSHANGSLERMAKRFQGQLAKANETPWLLATSEDMRYSTTEGGKPQMMTRLMHRYMDRVLEFLPQDAEASRAFFQVSHLMEPPSILFRPQIIAKVARRILRKPRATELVETSRYPLRTS